MNKIIQKIRFDWGYAHPTTLLINMIILVVLGVLSILLDGIVCETLVLCHCIFIYIYHFCNQKYKAFMVTNCSFFNKKQKCIEQRTRIKVKDTECGRNLFYMELEELIAAMKEGDVYVTATHQKVIDIIKRTPQFLNGKILVYIDDLSKEKNLTKIERMLGGKICNSCDSDCCKIKQALHDKEKAEIVTLHAVKIVCVKHHGDNSNQKPIDKLC